MYKKLLLLFLISIFSTPLFCGPKTETTGEMTPGQQLFQWVEYGNIDSLNDALLKGTPDLTVKSDDGETLVTLAASRGFKDILLVLLNNQAPKDMTNSSSQTPLIAAIEADRFDIAQALLLWDVNTLTKDDTGEDALFKVVKKEELELVERLLMIQKRDDSLDIDGNRSLHWAVKSGNINLIELLLPYYSSIDMANNNGETPISLGIEKNLEVLSALLKNQDLKTITYRDGSLLHYSVLEGDKELTQFLLEQEPELLNSVDNNSRIPLDVAMERPKSQIHMELAEILIRAGSPENRDPQLSYFYKTVLQNNSNIDFGGGDTALHIAADRNHSGITKILLDRYNPVIDRRNENGSTALLYAVRGGYEGMTEKLLHSGATSTLSNSNGISSIHYAVRLDNYQSMINLLTQTGASVNQQDMLGNTPLHSIIQLDLGLDKAEFLLGKGANPNIRNIQGNTPLLESILDEQKEVTQLLQGRSDIFAQNQNGLSPLTVVLVKDKEVLEWFFNENNIQLSDYQGNTVLHYAASYPQKELDSESIQVLLRKGAQIDSRNAQGKTPLHLSVESFYWSTSNYLVNQGANLYLLDNGGFSPLTSGFERGGDFTQSFLTEGDPILDLTDQQGNTPLFYAIQEGYPFIASLLINLGADYNHQNLQGVTPLLLSIERNDINLFFQLTDAGADILYTDKNGDGALHYLVKSSDSFATDLGLKLIEMGLDVNSTNNQYMSPLHYSCQYKNHQAIKFLVDKGANLEISDDQGFTPIFFSVMENDLSAYRFLKSNGANIKVRDYQGNTLLHGAIIQALQSPNKDLIRLLISDGADIYGLNSNDDSPITLAITLGPIVLDRVLFSDSVNLQNHEGNSPLHIALEISEDSQVWELLLELGADPRLRNGKGLTPYHLGLNMGYSEAELEILNPRY